MATSSGFLVPTKDELVFMETRRTIAHRLLRMIRSHGKEFCFVLIVIFTAYAALQTSPLKTKKPNPPKRFFASNSLVTDYYRGNVQQAFDDMQDSDVTFTFYYAPWDAASMRLRSEFEKTAQYYHRDVSFAAVNCWWPEGGCKRQFPKIHSFPVLIAYRNNGKGIQFHGPLSAPHLVTFLNHVINPLNVVRTPLDLLRLLSKHNTVVLALFNFNESPQPPGYVSYYTAALKAIEKDPVRDVSFAVISNIFDAVKFGINGTGTIQLHSWNSTRVSFTTNRFSWQQLLQWVFNTTNEFHLLKRLAPPAVKSQLLSTVLETSPTIILLTPRFVTSSLLPSPFYYLLKEVALDYFNCNNSMYTNNLIHVTKMETHDLKLKRDDDTKECYDDTVKECCRSLVHSTVSCELCESCDFTTQRNLSRFLKHVSYGCFCVDGFYRSATLCCHDTNEISQYDKTVLASNGNKNCLLRNHSNVAAEMHFPSKRSSFLKVDRFTGLGCVTNKTLAFATMDSIAYDIFFERLGINVSLFPFKTALAIVDNEQESHYVLEQPINGHTLREFILNFTNGVVHRNLRSTTSVVTTNVASPSKYDVMFDERIEIVEISSSNFHIIMEDTKDVVLLVYSPWCVFCSGIAHIYLSVARYFQAAKDVLFARINGDLNDLPWEFTVDKYPTILFFPAYKKCNSVEFPDDIPITVASLIHFVLTNAKLDIKLRTALSLCTSKCIAHNRGLAITKIQLLLREYRMLEVRLRGALETLQALCKVERKDSNRVDVYEDYAKNIVREMCLIQVKLNHARTLHLVLSTAERDHLTSNQLRVLTRSHNEFRDGLRDRQCKGLNARLGTVLKNCSSLDT